MPINAEKLPFLRWLVYQGYLREMLVGQGAGGLRRETPLAITLAHCVLEYPKARPFFPVLPCLTSVDTSHRLLGIEWHKEIRL